MPEELTAETAAQAVAAAWETDEPAPAAQDTAPSGDPESNQDKPSGLFYDVDPNTLTPEMRTMFDGMQRAFTEKNQALSEERRQFEALGGFDTAQQAVEFVSSLQDPQNLLALHSELSDYLQTAGYTKDDADRAAASAIQEQQTSPDESEYGFSDPETTALKSELEELKAWRDSFEAEQETRALEFEIERMENTLRNDRGYGDGEISRIYDLAYAFGGNLFEAADAYDSWKNELIASYVQEKGSVPVSPTASVVGAFGQEPKSFGSDFEAAHQEAKRIAIAAMQAGEFAD